MVVMDYGTNAPRRQTMSDNQHKTPEDKKPIIKEIDHRHLQAFFGEHIPERSPWVIVRHPKNDLLGEFK
jgi:hypothetical protein